MTQLNAFIARSFAANDEERIRPILDFLDTFRKLGFLCETADAAEVESVSKKVQRMIDDKEVFIGIFTRKYPLFTPWKKIFGSIHLAIGKNQPRTWTTPAWVLQESGYALAKGKHLILLREVGVEEFALQGDLEFVPFDPKTPMAVFPKLNEMILGLMARASGTEVKFTVIERKDETQVAPEPSAEQSRVEPKKDDTKGDTAPSILQMFLKMRKGAAAGDFEALKETYTAGNLLISEKPSEDIDQVFWDCHYAECRFHARDPKGLQDLKRLCKDHPDREEPRTSMARCLNDSGEFEAAASLFMEAAGLQSGDDKLRSLIDAGKAYKESKQFEQGKKAVVVALQTADGELLEEATTLMYQLLTDSLEPYFGFAFAESALQMNPQHKLRFSLGLGYRRKGLYELALHHFKFLYDHNDKDSSSLHNLALLYSENKMPILSVQHYKTSIDMGETLSSANLASKYLEGGMADDAKGLLDAAIVIEGHNSQVEKRLAEVGQKTDADSELEKKVLEIARNQKSIFSTMGQAMNREHPDISGVWKLPSGEIPLTRSADLITGIAEVKSETSSIGVLSALVYGSQSQQSIGNTIKTEKFTMSGRMIGAACQFDISVSEAGGGVVGSLSGISVPGSARSGFILFEADAVSGTYVELTGGKPGTPTRINKVGAVAVGG